MPFIYKGSLRANAGRVLKEFVITNAQVISVGEAVKLTSGKVVTWGAGGAGLGIVAVIRKTSGAPVTDNGDGGAFVGTYTAGSAEDVVAVVDVSKDSIYSAPHDDTIATTTGSGLAGYNVDTDADSQTLNESSTVSTTASFLIWGIDNSEGAQSNAVLVSIQESQIDL